MTPNFVDFLVASNTSGYSLTSTPFYYETLLNESQPHLRLTSLGRSGLRTQQCFSLVGIEKSREGGRSALENWRIQYTTAYHSFDLLSNQALWIIVKGNDLIRERLSSTTRSFLKRRPDYPQTRQGCFLASLSSHIVIAQWCTEGWDDYLDEVEGVLTKTYVNLSRASPSNCPIKTAIPKWSNRSNTTGGFLEQGNQKSSSSLREVSALLAGLEESLHSSDSVIENNREVLDQIKEYFDDLTYSATLQKQMDLRPFGEDVSIFFRDIKLFYKRLGNQRKRLQSLLWLLTSRRAEVSYFVLPSLTHFPITFHQILVCQQSMVSSDSQQLQRSSEEQRMFRAEQLQQETRRMIAISREETQQTMENATAKSRREAESMLVIIMLTMIFLPATFLAVSDNCRRSL